MQNNNTYAPKHIEISQGLIDYLMPIRSGSFSRCDAFHYLVDKATNFSGSLTHMGKDLDLLPGEFIATVTELSKAWGWERRRTRVFIEELQSLGVIQFIAHKKFYQIDMIAIRFKWLTKETPILCAWECQKNHLDDSLAEALNDPFKTIPFDKVVSESSMKDSFSDCVGNDMYTSEQRIEAAKAVLPILSNVYRSFLISLYSPRVEKSILDTFHKRCGGDPKSFAQAIQSIVDGLDKGIVNSSRTVYAEMLEKATELLSDASKESDAREFTSTLTKAKKTRKTKPKQ